MSCPSNCLECKFSRSCNSGMYMNGCHFYGPADRPKTIVTKIKEFFGKFFA